MTFVVHGVNTEVVGGRGTLATMVIDEEEVHRRIVRLIEYVLEHGVGGERVSQESIAKATERLKVPVSQSAISTWVNGGRQAKLGLAQSVVRALKADVRYLTSERRMSPEEALSGSVAANDRDALIDSFAAEREAEGRPIPAEVVDRLRRDVAAWDGLVTRDHLVMLVPIATERARGDVPLPKGRRMVQGRRR